MSRHWYTTTWYTANCRHEDVFREPWDLSAAVSLEALFGEAAEEDVRAVLGSSDLLNQYVTEEVTSLVPVPRWVPPAKNRRVAASIAALDAIFARLIGARRASEGVLPHRVG